MSNKMDSVSTYFWLGWVIYEQVIVSLIREQIEALLFVNSWYWAAMWFLSLMSLITRNFPLTSRHHRMPTPLVQSGSVTLLLTLRYMLELYRKYSICINIHVFFFLFSHYWNRYEITLFVSKKANTWYSSVCLFWTFF